MRARLPYPGGAVLGASALAIALLCPSVLLARTDCSQVSQDGTTTVEVRVLEPEDGGLVLRGPYGSCGIPVSGLASAVGLPARFDIYLVLDTSGSTESCAGVDVDGDTVVGQWDPLRMACTDRGDTVLAAEVAGSLAFLDQIELGDNRVGVIGFSDPNLFGVTQTYVSLTDDRALAEAALDTLFRRGPRGATDFEGAQDLLGLELFYHGVPDRDWVALFLSDGWPTFPQPPYNESQQEDWDAASEAADRLALMGVRLFTFAVGVDAGDPVLRDMALRTGGRFAAVRDPGDLVAALPATVLVRIAALVVSNLTTGMVELAKLGPAGDYEVLLNGYRGWNELDATAYATDPDHTRASCPLRAYLSCASGCQARTQGFWQRQCMGIGEIVHGGAEPPLLVEGFEDMAEAVSGALAFSGQTACQALEAEPASEMCEKALKQYAALLMNMTWGILGPDCETDLSSLGPGLPPTVGEAADLVEEWIREGTFDSCRRANDLADALNTGQALAPSVAPRVVPFLPVLTTGGSAAPAGADRRRPGRLPR
jgi:hypothetical protein